MNLDEVAYKKLSSQMIFFIITKSLKIFSLKFKLIKRSSNSKFPGYVNIKDHCLQPKNFVYWKYCQIKDSLHQIKYSLQHFWKEPYQVLLTILCVAKL